MRHSRQYQQDIYDKMTTNEKVKLDVQFASKQLWQVLHCPLPATDLTYFKSSIDDSDKYSDKPSGSNTVVPGKLFAMLAGDSTDSSPKLRHMIIICIPNIPEFSTCIII